MTKRAKGLFVVGTGTDVGKTYVTGQIMKALREQGMSVGYFKGALSGAVKEGAKLIPLDAKYVKETAKLRDSLEEMVMYTYEHSLSPHLAAKIEGNPLVMEKVKEGYDFLADKYEYLLVEGSGGIICPIRYDEEKIILEDIIKELNIPCILIADAALGTINATVLTAHYMKDKSIPLLGVVLNNYDEHNICHRDNAYMITQLTDLPIILTISAGQENLEVNKEEWIKYFNVEFCKKGEIKA